MDPPSPKLFRDGGRCKETKHESDSEDSGNHGPCHGGGCGGGTSSRSGSDRSPPEGSLQPLAPPSFGLSGPSGESRANGGPYHAPPGFRSPRTPETPPEQGQGDPEPDGEPGCRDGGPSSEVGLRWSLQSAYRPTTLVILASSVVRHIPGFFVRRRTGGGQMVRNDQIQATGA